MHVSVNKVLVGKQTSNRARWIFHCGALLMRGSRGVLPRDCIVILWPGLPSVARLKEFGLMSYLPVIVRDGNPHLGCSSIRPQANMKGCLIMHSNVFPVQLCHFLEHNK